MRTFKRNMRSAGAGIDEGCDRALPVNGTRRSGYDAACNGPYWVILATARCLRPSGKGC